MRQVVSVLKFFSWKYGIGKKTGLSYAIPVIFLLALAAGIFATILMAPSKPEFQGRSLDSWLPDLYDSPNESMEKAKIAIQTMGTNAIPRLLQLLRHDEPKVKRACLEFLVKHKILSVRIPPPYARQELASLGFRALGQEAAPAIPELIKLLRGGSELAKMNACHSLVFLGTAQAAIVPALSNALVDPNIGVRVTAEDCLGWMDQEPSSAVNALVIRLCTTNVTEFFAVADALRRFGPKARAVEPAVLDCLDSSNPFMRWAATNLLRAIRSDEVPAPSRHLTD